MRTLMVVLTCVAVVALAPAAAAQQGQRDPFEPLISEDQGTGQVPSGIVDPGTGTDQPSDQSPTTSGGSPNTGMPADDWSGLAYMLIALGAAAVIVARLRRPLVEVPRRRR
jgi:hypothetical protein